MLILLDHGTPSPIRPYLKGHSVKRTQDLGWDRLTNGELLSAAEQAGFEVLLTTDKNMRYQQDLTGLRLAVVVLGNAQWPVLRRHVHRIVEAAERAKAGSFIEVDIPSR